MVNLSIIIPAYNAEKYILRCLNSIYDANQQAPSFLIELIIVNDGSTDRTLEKINQISKKFLNFKIINQKNIGVSISRNVALTRAIGKYVWMIDADDYISKDSIRVLEKNLTDNDNEIISFCYFLENKGTFKRKTVIRDDLFSKTIEGTEFLNKNDGRLYLWTNVYSKKFLDESGVTFNKSLYNLGDSLYNIKLFINADKVLVLTNTLYYYCENKNSISRKNTQEKILMKSKSSFIVHNELYKLVSYLENKKEYEKSKIVLQKLNHSILGYFYSLYYENYSYYYVKLQLKIYKKYNLYPIPSGNNKMKAKIFSFIVNNSFLFLLLCKLKHVIRKI
jgi:glycosyltransferase involved in cell wall biosynthesis